MSACRRSSRDMGMRTFWNRLYQFGAAHDRLWRPLWGIMLDNGHNPMNARIVGVLYWQMPEPWRTKLLLLQQSKKYICGLAQRHLQDVPKRTKSHKNKIELSWEDRPHSARTRGLQYNHHNVHLILHMTWIPIYECDCGWYLWEKQWIWLMFTCPVVTLYQQYNFNHLSGEAQTVL